MEFQTGDIGFVISKNNIFSKIIAKVMKSKWSHSFLIINESETIETEIALPFKKSVHVDTIACHTEDPNKAVEIWRPIDQTNIFLTKIRAQCILGQAYSYILMILLGIRCLFDRKFRNLYRKGFVCCTVVLYSYGMDAWAWDTEEMHQYVSTSGKFIKIYEKQ
jgi:hypothetical protein